MIYSENLNTKSLLCEFHRRRLNDAGLRARSIAKEPRTMLNNRNARPRLCQFALFIYVSIDLTTSVLKIKKIAVVSLFSKPIDDTISN